MPAPRLEDTARAVPMPRKCHTAVTARLWRGENIREPVAAVLGAAASASESPPPACGTTKPCWAATATPACDPHTSFTAEMAMRGVMCRGSAGARMVAAVVASSRTLLLVGWPGRTSCVANTSQMRSNMAGEVPVPVPVSSLSALALCTLSRADSRHATAWDLTWVGMEGDRDSAMKHRATAACRASSMDFPLSCRRGDTRWPANDSRSCGAVAAMTLS